ncbi:transposase domain-containing protein [Marivita sp.]|uniref:transposase domain-containing protein n=1 Tax=Marivita sp. TaxID=2003365 RepID=UPI003F6FB3A5
MREPDQTWWSAAELAEAALPDLPGTKRKVNEMAKRDGWDVVKGKVRRRKAKGGGLEYHWTVLPMRARLKLSRQAGDPTPSAEKEPVSSADAWSVYAQVKDNAKEEAQRRFKALKSVDALVRAGLTRYNATDEVAKDIGVSARTIWNWHDFVIGVPADDWLPYLVPRHQVAKRKSRKAEIDPEFFKMVKSAYLSPSQPPLTACYDWTCDWAMKEGIPIPPIHQVRRHYKAAVSKPTEIYWRKGSEALRRFYPHQTRDKSAMVPLECVQGDYHKFDVFVAWPGEEKPVRVQAVFFSDVYSGKVLTYRLDTTANSHTVQVAFGDLVESYGIPQACLLDNGREFAAKAMTGGTPTRFRFKITDEDIPGLLTLMGVEVMWATPYSGQSKPIERAFRDLCDRIAKHPAFEGAYTGHKVDAKPDNYASRAIPLEDFRKVVEREVAKHNARPDRRSPVAMGKSFNEVFNAAYKTSPIRKATEEQRRLWLLRAEGVRANSKNGAVSLYKSDYWSEWAYRIAGQKVVVRFDPDDLYEGVEIYDLDGAYLGFLGLQVEGPFRSVEGAKNFNSKRNSYARAERRLAKAERELSAAQIAARLDASGADAQPDDLPEADILRLPTPHPAAPRARRHQPSIDQVEAEERAEAQITRLAERRAAADASKEEDEEDPRVRFERAQAFETAQDEGHALTPEQAAWLTDYQLSSEYRGFARMARAIGKTEQDRSST